MVTRKLYICQQRPSLHKPKHYSDFTKLTQMVLLIANMIVCMNLLMLRTFQWTPAQRMAFAAE